MDNFNLIDNDDIQEEDEFTGEEQYSELKNLIKDLFDYLSDGSAVDEEWINSTLDDVAAMIDNVYSLEEDTNGKEWSVKANYKGFILCNTFLSDAAENASANPEKLTICKEYFAANPNLRDQYFDNMLSYANQSDGTSSIRVVKKALKAIEDNTKLCNEYYAKCIDEKNVTRKSLWFELCLSYCNLLISKGKMDATEKLLDKLVQSCNTKDLNNTKEIERFIKAVSIKIQFAFDQDDFESVDDLIYAIIRLTKGNTREIDIKPQIKEAIAFYYGQQYLFKNAFDEIVNGYNNLSDQENDTKIRFIKLRSLFGTIISEKTDFFAIPEIKIYAQNDKLSAYKTLFHEFETMSVDKFNEALERIRNDPDEKMKIIDFPNLLKKTFIVRRMLMLMKTISQIKIEKLAELFKIKDITEMERYVVATSIDSGFTIKYDQIDGIVINFKNKKENISNINKDLTEAIARAQCTAFNYIMNN